MKLDATFTIGCEWQGTLGGGQRGGGVSEFRLGHLHGTWAHIDVLRCDSALLLHWTRVL